MSGVLRAFFSFDIAGDFWMYILPFLRLVLVHTSYSAYRFIYTFLKVKSSPYTPIK